MASDTDNSLMSVRDLRTWYPIRRGVFQRVAAHVKAVDGVSFEIPARRTLALVGESGCGKTSVGKSILRLVEPTGGAVYYRDRNLAGVPRTMLRAARRELQIIFQDPYSSLNPRQTVGETVAEGLAIHRLVATGPERLAKTQRMLQKVGITGDAIGRYPHEFSGGQRQRIAIARALIIEPRFVVCDEPVSALDVSIQAQILNLLKGLQEELGLTYLFITHDLSVVEYLADEVAVMYLGKIVERAPAELVFDNPRHPYTKALLSSVPEIDPAKRHERTILAGDVPSPVDPPPGCHFHPRCPLAQPACSASEPPLLAVESSHLVKCFVVQKEAGLA